MSGSMVHVFPSISSKKSFFFIIGFFSYNYYSFFLFYLNDSYLCSFWAF